MKWIHCLTPTSVAHQTDYGAKEYHSFGTKWDYCVDDSLANELVKGGVAEIISPDHIYPKEKYEGDELELLAYERRNHQTWVAEANELLDAEVKRVEQRETAARKSKAKAGA